MENLYAILEKYTSFCHKELISGNHPEDLEYLNKRKTNKDEIIFFKIGYSSPKNDFYERLVDQDDLFCNEIESYEVITEYR